jgi:glycosyltransferase involved in cell wall biosynthesis
MILVDNGSSDCTGDVIRTAEIPGIVIRRLHEACAGKSKALNLAIKNARGEVLLFTDDDVEPAPDWIEKMATPLLSGISDAVAGRIVLSEKLRRPWLTPYHGVFLAWTEPVGESPDLIGASMGIRKAVFDVIGPFDERLGPGASGFGEEALLCRQMREIGMRIHPVTDTHVVHHPQPSRLLRGSWISTATSIGASEAYIMYHWEHLKINFPRIKAALISLKLHLRRLYGVDQNPNSEGCSIWEMSYLIRISILRNYSCMSGKPRLYNLRGMRQKVEDSVP